MEKFEIKKGDWVKIKDYKDITAEFGSNLSSPHCFGGVGWASEMKKYCGQWHKVNHINTVNKNIFLVEDNVWTWTYEMISEVACEVSGYPKTGDIVMFEEPKKILESLGVKCSIDDVRFSAKVVDGVTIVPSMIYDIAKKNQNVWFRCNNRTIAEPNGKRISYFINSADAINMSGWNLHWDFARIFFKDVFLRTKKILANKDEQTTHTKHDFKVNDIVRFISKQELKEMHPELTAKDLNSLLDKYNNLFFVEYVDEYNLGIMTDEWWFSVKYPADYFKKVEIKENDIIYTESEHDKNTKAFAAHLVNDKILLRGLSYNDNIINEISKIKYIERLEEEPAIKVLYEIVKNGDVRFLNGQSRTHVYVKPLPTQPEKEVKEMTVKQIGEKLGYEVKIVKE